MLYPRETKIEEERVKEKTRNTTRNRNSEGRTKTKCSEMLNPKKTKVEVERMKKTGNQYKRRQTQGKGKKEK